MANVIKLKRGSGSDPSSSDLVVGEVAIRTDSGKLFTKKDNGTIAEISGSGGGSDIFINTLSSSSGTGGGSATFNGTATRFTLSNPPSVSAQQLLVSINGVVQKPNSGTSPSEGFAIDGNDIIFAAAPATGSDFFIVTYGSLNIAVPADNSVTSAKIVDGTIVGTDLATNVDLVDNQKIRFGTGNDLSIYHDSNNSYLQNGTGSLLVQGGSQILYLQAVNHEDGLRINPNGSVQLFFDGGGAKLETQAGGVYVSGSVNLTGELDLSGDTNKFVDFETINSKYVEFRHFGGSTYEKFIKATANGATELYFDGSLKFKTDSAGCEVAGALIIPDGSASGNRISVGNAGDLKIYHDGSSSRIIAANHDLIVQSNGYAIRSENGSSTFATITSAGHVSIEGANNTTFDHVAVLSLKGTDAYNSGNAGAGINFSGKYNSSGNTTTLAQISGIKESTGDGEYDGALTFGVRNDTEGVNIERMRITSSGFVGIGTSPDSILHIAHVTSPLLSFTSTDTSLAQDQLIGGIKTFKSDASGSGTGIAGGIFWRSDDSYGARSYIQFTNRQNSTGQTNTDTECMRIKSNGDVSITHGNLVVTAGHGIDFSATSDASGMSNELLDDYEEGTWTPEISGSSGISGQTYSVQSGFYTRIGNRVYCDFNITVGTKGSYSGTYIQIVNLPFTINSSSTTRSICTPIYFRTLNERWCFLGLQSYEGQNKAFIFGVEGTGSGADGASNRSYPNGTDIANGTQMTGSFSYLAA